MNVKVTGSGDPLLMIHGIMSDHRFFSVSVQELSASYRVITYDRTGYGLESFTRYDDDVYSIGRQADDAAEMLLKEGAEGSWVLGYSAGCQIAVRLALKYPGMARGLILFEPAFGFKEDDRAMLAGWHEELLDYRDSEEPYKAFKAFERLTNPGGKKIENREGLTSDSMKRAVSNLKNFLYGELDEIHRNVSEEEVKGLRIPAIIGISEEGRHLFFGMISANDAEVSGLQVFLFPGRHNSAAEFPKEFSRKVMEIIEQYEKQGEEHNECVGIS